METDEQTTRLLGSHDRDRFDLDDLEQGPARVSFSNNKEYLRIDWLNPTWRAPNWRKRAAVALLVGLLWGALGYALGFSSRTALGSSSMPPAAPLRVMVVGDSISQGWEGSHTWRYRLWQWFQANNIDVTFIGPYNGTASPLPEDPSTRAFQTPDRFNGEIHSPFGMEGGYAPDVEAEFLHTGSAHFAVWGRKVVQDIDLIGRQIRDYSPDLLLVELGFNDLTWGGLGPEEALLKMEELIDKARAADPELRFAVANVPQRTKVEDLDVRTKQYNDKLRKAITTWSSPSSPIELVEFREAYSCGQDGCPASFDGLHPNSQGEIEIAHAFSKTLYHKFNIGDQPLSLPAEFPSRICLTPDNPSTYAGPEGIKFTWDSVYGAYGYEVQVRPEGVEWAVDSFNHTWARHMDTSWTTNGARWEFRVRSYCEMTVKSPWSHGVSDIVE